MGKREEGKDGRGAGTFGELRRKKYVLFTDRPLFLGSKRYNWH
jgi:hypothetical protein